MTIFILTLDYFMVDIEILKNTATISLFLLTKPLIGPTPKGFTSAIEVNFEMLSFEYGSTN